MSDPIDLGPEEHRMKITIPDFMHDWVSKNIHSQAYPTEGGIDAEPEALAMRCLADAEAEGLSLEALEAQFGNLTIFMQSELKRIADLQVVATRI
jgi:hypothetical protein